jgi:hypothetical protein
LPAATSAATNHLPSGSLAKSIDRLEHLLCHRSKVALPFDFHSLKTDTTCAMPSHLPTNRPASALTTAKAWTQMSSEVLATKLSKIALSKAREALRPHAPRLAGCCKPQISQPSLVSYRLVVACQQAVSPAQGNFLPALLATKSRREDSSAAATSCKRQPFRKRRTCYLIGSRRSGKGANLFFPRSRLPSATAGRFLQKTAPLSLAGSYRVGSRPPGCGSIKSPSLLLRTSAHLVLGVAQKSRLVPASPAD